jgi:galactitol-specific phosphotransferase system IIB component
MKIITVHGSGLGTSILLQLTAQTALQRLHVDATVEALARVSVDGFLPDADLLLVSPELAGGLARAASIVRPVHDPLDLAEVARQISLGLGQRSPSTRSPLVPV